MRTYNQFFFKLDNARSFHLLADSLWTSQPFHYFCPITVHSDNFRLMCFGFLFVCFFDVLNSMSGNADRSSDWVSSQNLMLLQTWLIKPGILQPGQFYSGLDRHVHTSLYNSLWRITLLFPDDVQLVSVQPLASVFVFWSICSCLWCGFLLRFVLNWFRLQQCASMNRNCFFIYKRLDTPQEWLHWVRDA